MTLRGATSGQEVEGILDVDVEGQFAEDVVQVDTEFSLALTVLVQQGDQVGSSLSELIQVLLDIHLFHHLQLVGWLGQGTQVHL